MRSNKLFRVAFIPTANAGVNYYRLATWAFELRRFKGVEAALFAFQYGMNDVHPWQRDFSTNPYIRQDIEALCDMADVVVWGPLQCQHTLDFFLEMQHKYQKPMVVDADDNFRDVPEWNEAFHSYRANSSYRTNALAHIQNANALFVTTDHLKSAYSDFNDQVFIVPNSLDFKGDSKFVGWDKVSVKKHRGIRIGWIGGRTHFTDLMMVSEPLREVLKRNKDVSLVLVNSALKLSCQELSKPYPFEGLNVNVADRSVPINRYAKFAASFGFDIGIAPLEDCNFNRSKSNLRWLEYSAMSIPCVASDLVTFSSIENGKTGLLAAGNDSWIKALQFLIDSENERKDMGSRAHKEVKSKFNVRRNAGDYLKLLKNIAGRSFGEGELCSFQNSNHSLAI